MHIPEIFRLLQEWGNVKTKEMYQTFNMGLGFVIIMPEADANKFVGTEGSEQGAKIIGKVEAGCGLSAPSLNLEF